MKRQVFVVSVEVVLIGLLSVYGWLLIDGLPPSRVTREQILIETNKRLRFADASGIDVWGERVNPLQVRGTNGIIAFLLRNASLGRDLRFWQEVSGLIPKGSGICLVGYCDGSACAEAMRNNPLSGEFPIIEYGEIIDSQALINADMEGAFIMVVKDKNVPSETRVIRWRDLGQTPASLVRSIWP